MTPPFSPLLRCSGMALLLALSPLAALAAIPSLLNHQGRIAVDGVNFEGRGLFKFALVDATGATTYWSNDGTSIGGAAPAAAVSLTVTRGLYAVLLGDDSIPQMAPVPASVFEPGDVRLRVWFNDGEKGFQQIVPDQRFAAAPYALMAQRADAANSAATFSGGLAGEVTGTQGATAIAAAAVTGKVLTGLGTSAGVVSAADSILSAIGKLNSNLGLKANAASPTFTGTVTGNFSGSLAGNASSATTAASATTAGTATHFSGALAGEVTGTQGATAIAAGAVTGKALTGLAAGTGAVTASDTVLSAIGKLNSNLGLKANLASPTFTGTVALPAGTAEAAPLRLMSGSPLAAPVAGAVEFDGSNLYVTTGAANPTRKALAFAEALGGEVALSSVVAPPPNPVVAWGKNANGQTSVPSLSGAVAVAGGEGHSLALVAGGKVVAWGLNTSGQTAVPDAALSGVVDIAAGNNHNVVCKSDGSVVGWGANLDNQTAIPSGLGRAVKVAAGQRHSLALLEDGSVRAWGDNSFGQATVPSLVSVTAIAAGYDHCLALQRDGTVVAWGRGAAPFGTGQAPAPSLTGVVAIAAGGYHSLALKSDGSVVAWGWNSAGQTEVPTAAQSGVVQIAAGYLFSMALKADGTFIFWGDGSNGLLSIPAAAARVSRLGVGTSHALVLLEERVPARLARLDQDNVFGGKVGIMRSPGVQALEVEGNASKSTAGNWLANSDRRIKADIAPIAGALEKLSQVRLVDFRYTEAYRAAHPGIPDVRYPNVIAQEFAAVFPDQVHESGELLADGSPILQVDTYPLTIYTAAAVQELQRENQQVRAESRQIQAENARIKEQLATQEARLRRLEAALEKSNP